MGLILAVLACYLVGYALLLVDAHSLAIPAAVLIGIGCCVFPVVLTLIGLRAHTPDGTAALSGFTQSLGYLLAALGPFLVGIIYDATGGWTVPAVAARHAGAAADGRRRVRRAPGVPGGPAALTSAPDQPRG